MKKREMPQVEPVVLHEWKGKRAGFWIFIGLICALIILIFAFCFLPGIVKGGRYVNFETALTDVGVSANGKYLGPANNNQYFLKAGTYSLEYKKAGVVIGNAEVKISNPLVFTFFKHYRKSIVFDSYPDTTKLLEATKAEYYKALARYSAISDYSDSYFYKSIITDFFTDSLELNSSTIKEDYNYTLLHITTKEMYEDLIKAEALLASRGVKPTDPLRSTLDELFNEGDKKALTLTSTLNAESGVYETIEGAPFFSYKGGEIVIGRSTTLSYPELITAPVSVELKPFSFAMNMISEAEYATFVKDKPYWAKSNIDTLINDGMVDEYYLDGVNTNLPASLPIRNISYNAALAYVAYMNEKGSVKYTLPSEAQFEYVASAVKNKQYTSALYVISLSNDAPLSVMGGLWEFTSDSFLPLSRVGNYEEAIALQNDYDDIIIKGGSYINDSSEIKASDVGLMDRKTTSPYVGIRLCVEK